MAQRAMNFEDHTNPPGSLDGGRCTFNRYATQITLANTSFDIAFIVTNAVQLKTLLSNKTNQDTLWYVGLAFVCASLFIQVINACILAVLGKGDISKERRQHRLVLLNNISLILSVLSAIINVFLSVIVAVNPKILVPTLQET